MKAKLVPLGSVAEIVRTGIDPSSVPAGTRYVGLDDISGDGQISENNSVEACELASTKFAFGSNHVLFGKLRPYLRKVAKPTFSGICSTDIIPIAPTPELDRSYLFHFLRTDAVIQRATSMASGANLPRISPRHLLGFEVPVPALDEQRRIAAILDQADELRRNRELALQKLENLPRSLFRQAFGDLASNDRGWPSGTVSNLLEGFDSGKSLVAADEDDTMSPFRVLKISSVTSLKFLPAESKALPHKYVPPNNHLVRRGDLLFSRANTSDLIGATALVDCDCEGLALPDKLWRFRWCEDTQTEPLFVWQLFMQPSFRDQIRRRATGTSGSMKNISQEKVMGIEIGIPDSGLQREFALNFTRLRGVTSSMQRQKEALDALFASLQHRAFSGELTRSDDC